MKIPEKQKQPGVTFIAEDGRASLEVRFTRASDRVAYTYGPFLAIEDVPMDTDPRQRAMYGTHTRGRDLLAVGLSDGPGWLIMVEPVRGIWNATYIPIDQSA